MFTLDDDFDVDVEFLEGAFCTAPIGRVNAESARNIKHDGRVIIENDDGLSPTSKNNSFVELWKAKDEKIFSTPSKDSFSDSRNLLEISRALSPQGFRSDVVTRFTKNVRPRRFPGPAGLLPQRTSNTSFIAAEEYISKLENENNLPEFEEKEIQSQSSNKLFEEPGGAWCTMIYDLEPHGERLISTINLLSLRGKQARSGFKVPLLAVTVHTIDCSLPDPSLLLKDRVEEMHGTLHRDVWEEWKGEVVVGSVLLLRNVGVVSTGRRHFLNITANNIITIYSPKSDSSVKISQIKSTMSWDSSQIFEEWERVTNQSRQQQADVEQEPRPLFTMFSPAPSPRSDSRVKLPHQGNVRQAQPHWLGGLSPLPSVSPLPTIPSFKSNPPKKQPQPSTSTNVSNSKHMNSPIWRPSPSVNAPSIHQNIQKHPQPRHVLQSSSVTKKPRISLPNPTVPAENRKPNSLSVFTLSQTSEMDRSIVESFFDGIDTDSLFEDF